MTPDDLQQQLKEVCVEVTHEARDSRLTASEVFEYLTVINSAAQISTGLTRRIERVGLEETKNDIFRFVGVAIKKILKIRQAVEKRERGWPRRRFGRLGDKVTRGTCFNAAPSHLLSRCDPDAQSSVWATRQDVLDDVDA